MSHPSQPLLTLNGPVSTLPSACRRCQVAKSCALECLPSDLSGMNRRSTFGLFFGLWKLRLSFQCPPMQAYHLPSTSYDGKEAATEGSGYVGSPPVNRAYNSVLDYTIA
jgi:hypothetical protein